MVRRIKSWVRQWLDVLSVAEHLEMEEDFEAEVKKLQADFDERVRTEEAMITGRMAVAHDKLTRAEQILGRLGEMEKRLQKIEDEVTLLASQTTIAVSDVITALQLYNLGYDPGRANPNYEVLDSQGEMEVEDDGES